MFGQLFPLFTTLVYLGHIDSQPAVEGFDRSPPSGVSRRGLPRGLPLSPTFSIKTETYKLVNDWQIDGG